MSPCSTSASTTRVLHAGKRTLVVEADVLQDDRLVAKGQGTFAQL